MAPDKKKKIQESLDQRLRKIGEDLNRLRTGERASQRVTYSSLDDHFSVIPTKETENGRR